MRPDDLEPVMAIERAAYTVGWPATAFERELTQNAMARYIVLRAGEDCAIKAFGGLWLMVGEAHVVTVAVLPEERRKGLGRVVVHGLVQLARAEGMEVATLEVRVSNEPARALYREYGFYEVGRRKRYYSDNREDAIIMTTEDLNSPAYTGRLAQLANVLEERFPGVVPRIS
jgi:[ribosomal protein S18]-alanine N-acetyltransferase